MSDKKCCANCYYFRYSVDWDDWTRFHCELHNLHSGEVSQPQIQFCGDENWISVKAKSRIEKLNIILDEENN